MPRFQQGAGRLFPLLDYLRDLPYSPIYKVTAMGPSEPQIAILLLLNRRQAGQIVGTDGFICSYANMILQLCRVQEVCKDRKTKKQCKAAESAVSLPPRRRQWCCTPEQV